MHNQLNCWPVKSSPTRPPTHQTYNQRLAVNAHNQISQMNPPASQQQIGSQRVNPQINQHNQSNLLGQINSSPRGSFSSDQSTVNLSAAYLSDYSFASSSSSSNNSTSSHSMTSTMNNAKQLTNQAPMASQPVDESQIKAEFSIKSSVQLNQARAQNLPLCFNGLPTPGIGSKRK